MQNNLKEHFKTEFYKLRSERNMSQAAFAEFLGISRPTVGFYENGQRLPDAETLGKICRKCGVSADYLLGLSNSWSLDVDEQTAVKTTGLSTKAIKVLRYLNRSQIDNVFSDDVEINHQTLNFINRELELYYDQIDLDETHEVRGLLTVFFEMEQYVHSDLIKRSLAEGEDEKKSHFITLEGYINEILTVKELYQEYVFKLIRKHLDSLINNRISKEKR